MGQQPVDRGLLELGESLGTLAVGRLGMGIVPEGHWCRMVAMVTIASRRHPSLSFLERRAGSCVENCRTRQEAGTSSIAISLGGR